MQPQQSPDMKMTERTQEAAGHPYAVEEQYEHTAITEGGIAPNQMFSRIQERSKEDEDSPPTMHNLMATGSNQTSTGVYQPFHATGSPTQLVNTIQTYSDARSEQQLVVVSAQRNVPVHPVGAPFYQKLNEVQAKVVEEYPMFPLQKNKDFLEKNYEAIIIRAADQIQYLFTEVKRRPPTIESAFEVYTNPQATPIQMHEAQQMKGSLAKSNELIKVLKRENEYFQRQIEILRQEQAQLRTVNENQGRGTSLKQGSQMSRSDGGGDTPHARSGQRQYSGENQARNNHMNILSSAQQAQIAAYGHPIATPDPVPYRPLPFQMQPHPQQALVDFSAPLTHSKSQTPIKGYPNMGMGSAFDNQPLPVLNDQRAKRNPSTTPGFGTSLTNSQQRRPIHQVYSKERDEDQENKSRKGENKDTVGANQENARLRFELKQKEEILGLKMDQIKTLEQQIDSQKEEMQAQVDALREQYSRQDDLKERRLEDAKMGDLHRDQIIEEIKRQLDNSLSTRQIDVTMLVNKQNALPEKQMLLQSASSATTVKQQKPERRQANHVPSKQPTSQQQKNLKLAMEINKEMEMVLGTGIRDSPPDHTASGTTMELPQVFSLNKKGKKQKAKQQNVMQQLQGDPTWQNVQLGMFTPAQLLQNQVQAAMLTDNLIDELQLAEDRQKGQLLDLDQKCMQVEKHQTHILEDRAHLTRQCSELTAQNDALKHKFSVLLDQFQKYVTDQESKQVKESEIHKKQQESLLSNMQENIRDLEQVTEGLQGELAQKENVFKMVKRENDDLEQKLKDYERIANEEMAVKDAVHTLEDEIRHIKQHYEIQLNDMRAENEQIKKYSAQAAEQQHRRTRSRDRGANRAERELQRDERRSEYSPRRSKSRSPNNIRADYISSPIKDASISISASNANYTHHDMNQSQLVSPHNPTHNQNRVKEIISTTQSTFEKLKRELSEKNQAIEDKNREILKLKIQNEEMQNVGGPTPIHVQMQNSQSLGGVLDGETRRQVIKEINYLTETMKGELVRLKAQLYAEFGLHASPRKSPSKTSLHTGNNLLHTEEQFYGELQAQLVELRQLINYASEVAMLVNSHSLAGKNKQERSVSPDPTRDKPQRNSVQKQDHFSHHINQRQKSFMTGQEQANNVHDTNYQIKRQADNLYRQGQVPGLYELVLQQITRCETCMQDNALLQRQIYKHENTMSELDAIFRTGSKRDEVIFELKKMVESQMKQNNQLQKDNDCLRSCWPEEIPMPPTSETTAHVVSQQRLLNESNVAIDSLQRELNQIKTDNEELANERQNLLRVIEDLEGRYKNEQKLSDEKMTDFEDIRVRITRVAELFERKEIKQKYSFEVLCDFIYDKAKRLFNKYESVSKERKVMQEEKNFYYDRKLEQLEQDNQLLRESLIPAQKITGELIPLINDILEEPKKPDLNGHDPVSELHFASQVLEAIEIEHRSLMKRYSVLAGRNTEMVQQMDTIKGTSSMTNLGSQGGHYPPPGLSALSNNQTDNTSGFHMDTSLLDYRLKVARQQEEEEVARSQRDAAHHRLRNGATSGSRERPHDTFPTTSLSPLRQGSVPPRNAEYGGQPQQQLFNQGSSHSIQQMSEPNITAYNHMQTQEAAFKRTKSVEKDNKDGNRSSSNQRNIGPGKGGNHAPVHM